MSRTSSLDIGCDTSDLSDAVRCAVYENETITITRDGRPAAVIAPALPEVWVLVVSQPRGNSLGAYFSYKAARDELARWVRANWEHVAGGFLAGSDEGKPDSPDGLGDDAAIGLYFEDNDDEWYELEADQVHSAATLSQEA
jgi:antitoxin (DNA-binding transcriptional repressor) of toxin-antitoxin stability system